MNITVGKQEKLGAVIHLLFVDDYHLETLADWKLSSRMGKAGQVRWIYGRQDESHHLLLGLGKKADFTLERLREAAGLAGRAVREEQVQHVGYLSLPWKKESMSSWRSSLRPGLKGGNWVHTLLQSIKQKRQGPK